MGVTISTHNGSAVAREHNIRNKKVVSKESHIDMNGCHEIWVDEPVRKAYERLFSSSVEKYNARQVRPERRITSYYNAVCRDRKKHPVYEMVIGIYGKNEDGSLMCSDKQGKAIMQKFVKEWKERNPNLELIGAYYHADEPDSQPHVHIDYVPVAHGYTKGMETQTGLVRALGEQGFYKSGKATAQIQWEKRENDYLTSLCETIGLTVDHPKIEGKMHLATKDLKLQSRIDELERVFKQKNVKCSVATQNLKELENEIKAAQKRLESLQGRVLKQSEVNALEGKKSLTGAIRGISYEDYLSLKRTASYVKAVNKENKDLKVENERLVIERDKALEIRKSDFSRKQLKDLNREADNINKNRLLCNLLGIPEDANYDQTKRLLQQQGLVSVKNKNLMR